MRVRLLPLVAVLLVVGLAIVLHPWPKDEPPVQAPQAAPATAPATRSGAEPVTQLPAVEAATAPGLAVVEDSAAVASDDAPRVALRGRVRDPLGNGLDGVQIDVLSRDRDESKAAVFGTATRDGGAFVIDGLVAGNDYRLQVQPSGAYAGHRIDSFRAGDLRMPLEIVLDPVVLVNVDGMIVDTNLAPIPEFELNLRSLAAEYPDRIVRSDATGYFRLEGFPAGPLQIATNASDYYQIKGLELRPNEYETLSLMLDRGSYHLSGWVTDEDGLPVEEAQVTLKSAFSTGSYHSYAYRTAVTDANGAFEFAALGGHRATLGVYARGFRSHIQLHEFLSFSDRLEIRLQR